MGLHAQAREVGSECRFLSQAGKKRAHKKLLETIVPGLRLEPLGTRRGRGL